MTLLYAYAAPERGRGCWSWVIPRCPFCSKRHQHGGGPLDDDPRRLLGSRAPHCAPGSGDNMYWLTDDAAQQGQSVPERMYVEIGGWL